LPSAARPPWGGCFCRERRHEIDASLDPSGKRCVSSVSPRIDAHKTGRTPLANFQRLHMRQGQRPLVGFPPNANQEARAIETTTHVAIHHEDQPSHHRLFDNVRTSGEEPPYACC
jgi:hypothetical protein